MFIYYFLIHTFDYFFYKGTYLSLDMWQVLDPKTRKKWNKNRCCMAALKQISYQSFKILIMTHSAYLLITHKWC